MTKMPIYLQILLILLLISMTLPIAAGYIVSFFLLVWLSVSRNWSRAVFFESISKGALVWVVGFFVAAVGSYFVSPYGVAFSKTLSKYSHVFCKYYLLWIVIYSVFQHVKERGYDLRRTYRWFAGWLSLYFVYVLVQRYTGIDWVHGFGARIGAHQYAYGVYRFAGFMSHPLTLAYNLTLVVMLSVSFLMRDRHQRAWWVVAGLGGLILLLSGSRFPIIALLAALGICEYHRISKYKWWVLGFVGFLAVGLYLEGSMLARFSELFGENQSITQKIPRLIFWKVHSQMFLDHPIFGVGIAGRGQAVIDYYTSLGHHDKMYTAHNVYLQTLADTGIIGFFSFGVFFFCLAKTAWKRTTTGGANRTFLPHLIVLVALSGLLQNTLRDSEYVFAFWVCLAIMLCQSSDADSKFSRQGAHEPTGRKPPENQ